MSTHDLRGAINSAVDTTPVDQLLASLGYALGRIEAKAIVALTRAETVGAEASAAAGTLREIRDIARNAATTKPGEAEPAPAGVAIYPIGTRPAVVRRPQQPGGGAD